MSCVARTSLRSRRCSRRRWGPRPGDGGAARGVLRQRPPRPPVGGPGDPVVRRGVPGRRDRRSRGRPGAAAATRRSGPAPRLPRLLRRASRTRARARSRSRWPARSCTARRTRASSDSASVVVERFFAPRHGGRVVELSGVHWVRRVATGRGRRRPGTRRDRAPARLRAAAHPRQGHRSRCRASIAPDPGAGADRHRRPAAHAGAAARASAVHPVPRQPARRIRRAVSQVAVRRDGPLTGARDCRSPTSSVTAAAARWAGTSTTCAPADAARSCRSSPGPATTAPCLTTCSATPGSTGRRCCAAAWSPGSPRSCAGAGACSGIEVARSPTARDPELADALVHHGTLSRLDNEWFSDSLI